MRGCASKQRCNNICIRAVMMTQCRPMYPCVQSTKQTLRRAGRLLSSGLLTVADTRRQCPSDQWPSVRRSTSVHQLRRRHRPAVPSYLRSAQLANESCNLACPLSFHSVSPLMTGTRPQCVEQNDQSTLNKNAGNCGFISQKVVNNSMHAVLLNVIVIVNVIVNFINFYSPTRQGHAYCRTVIGTRMRCIEWRYFQ